MKEYAVFCDITVSKVMHIEAESEEQAVSIAEDKLRNNPYHYARSCDSYVSHEISDVYEE